MNKYGKLKSILFLYLSFEIHKDYKITYTKHYQRYIILYLAEIAVSSWIIVTIATNLVYTYSVLDPSPKFDFVFKVNVQQEVG